MINFRQITALFLLGSFLIMVVHSAIPHGHHVHESPVGTALFADHEHHSQEHNHHGHSDEKETESHDQNNLLSSLIDSHSHFFHIHDSVKYTKTDPSLAKGQVLSSSVAKITVFDFLSDIECQDRNKYVLTKESWSENPFLLSCSLRAPPSIG